MKKSVLSLMTLLMVTFFMSVSMISCDDDDEKNGGQTAKEMLVGQWVLIKDMTDINGETDTEEYPAEARQEILTFKADGSCSCQWPSENQTDNGKWVLSDDGKGLTVTIDSETPMSITVKELSSSKLVIYYEEEFEDMGDMIHLKSEMTYARL